MAIGPSGWTRTTTSRVKSPACCVDTTEGSGANDGIRTRTSRLGRPVGDRYPTFALVRPTGNAASRRRVAARRVHGGPREAWSPTRPPRWRRGMLPPHPGRTWTGAAHRPIDIVSVFKDPTHDELVGGKGFEPNRSPRGERGYGPPANHPLVPPVWRQRQDSNPDPRVLEARMLPFTPRCRCHLTCRPIRRHNLPLTWPILLPGLRPKQKRPSRGSP